MCCCERVLVSLPKPPNSFRAMNGRAVLDAVSQLSHSRCKACFYLNDSPNNLANWERAADVVSTVHKFNEAFPHSKIEGCCHEALLLYLL